MCMVFGILWPEARNLTDIFWVSKFTSLTSKRRKVLSNKTRQKRFILLLFFKISLQSGTIPSQFPPFLDPSYP